jgi:hypothetical protein
VAAEQHPAITQQRVVVVQVDFDQQLQQLAAVVL